MQLRVLQIVGPLWPVTKAGVSRGVWACTHTLFADVYCIVQTSLFCHVPLFSCYTLETQLDFACDLIQSICTQVLSM